MEFTFTNCDNHPAQGGSHRSRALVVSRYMNHPATVVMCTAPVGKVTRDNRHPCGNEYLILDPPHREVPTCKHGKVVTPAICKHFHAPGVIRMFPVEEETT